MKAIFLIIIVLLGIWAFRVGIPPGPYLVLLVFLAALPLVLIFLKKNLVNALLLWFLAVLFAEFGVIALPLLPDLPPHRILWISIFLIFLSELALKQRKIISGIIKIEIAMLILCVYIIFSMIVAGTIYKEGHGLVLNTFLSAYLVPFSIFFLAKNILDNEQKIKKIFIFFSIIGFYLGITGIFEYFNIRQLVFPRYIMIRHVGIHWGQARGPFLQAAVNGTVLGMIFFITVYLIRQNYKKWAKSFLLISAILILTSLFLTYTRASWLGFILSSLLVSIFFPQMRKVFLAGILAVALIVTFTQSGLIEKERVEERVSAASSVYDRINLYGAAWKMFLKKPVLGFGFNTFRDYSPKYLHTIKGIPFRGWEEHLSLHDTLASILVELGLIGLGLFILIIFYILKISINLYRRLPSGVFLGKGLVAVFWGIFVVFAVNIQFIEMRFFMFPNSLFFLLAGIIVGLNQRGFKKEETKINQRFY